MFQALRLIKYPQKDGEIDWRMSLRSIYNLVRALTRPYIGAHCVFDGREVKIWKVQIAEEFSVNKENLEPGKIIKIDPEGILVKCGEGVVKILEHEFNPFPSIGKYL